MTIEKLKWLSGDLDSLEFKELCPGIEIRGGLISLKFDILIYGEKVFIIEPSLSIVLAELRGEILDTLTIEALKDIVSSNFRKNINVCGADLSCFNDSLMKELVNECYIKYTDDIHFPKDIHSFRDLEFGKKKRRW